ncbi:TIM barrel protein [Sediminibacterium roseum]|uniref:TIM barrel protein n=1 Tax=Sediminibacterium roseum TaxID=1978412 RepID=A0ABW9ZMZ6_9BACT|nr:TIM barrel protein [Sediminibacterium roseum]NCI48449.1 TIM barrel protein [Sediminibacterium roseum]
MTQPFNRRNAIKNIIAGSAALAAGSSVLPAYAADKNTTMPALKGNINHTVCRWCFSSFTLDELCAAVKEMGLVGIDLVPPKDWPTLKKYGLVSTMCNGAEISLTKGWNDKQYHEQLIKNYTEHIDLVAAAGFKNLFCASGNRGTIDDETGLKNCVDGLKQVIGHAEKKGVVLTMELLNSKIDHKDYMCDRTPWGVELCKRIGSPNFKLLYDIYHMQIDEGDVIRTIRDYNVYFGHYHTAGVPGRHEIDETQELYYPAIMNEIKKTGFTGYVAQEFIPAAADKLGSLRKAVMICDV